MPCKSYSRPLRFTVELFEHKRDILKANSLLRTSGDSTFSNVYFTPDLTKNQLKIAYELRVERRLREGKGEQNLKISRGKVITVKKNENDSVSQGDGAAVGVAPRVRLK